MAKSVPALINPAMLVWARESARLTIDEAAHKIGIAADKLAACEGDEAQLMFPQLMKAAREYKRSVCRQSHGVDRRGRLGNRLGHTFGAK
jgi:hypothetical protein